MTEAILQADSSIFLFFNSLHTPIFDVLFYYISNRFVWIPFYLLLAFFLFRRYNKKTWLLLAAIVCSIFLSDQSCNIIKCTVERPRPSHEIELAGKVHLVMRPDGKLYKGGKFGFPSSHAANSMALAIFVITFLTRRKKILSALMLCWTLMISYSRIYLGVHYPSDIIVGWCIGALWSGLLVWLLYNTKPFKHTQD